MPNYKKGKDIYTIQLRINNIIKYIISMQDLDAYSIKDKQLLYNSIKEFYKLIGIEHKFTLSYETFINKDLDDMYDYLDKNWNKYYINEKILTGEKSISINNRKIDNSAVLYYLNKVIVEDFTPIKDTILKYHDTIKKIFKTGDFTIDDIIFIKIFQADRHDSKNLPVILIQINNKYIVFKPRNAAIDVRIMKLFYDINKVNKRQLGIYNIITCDRYSLWDYIDSPEKQSYQNPSDYANQKGIFDITKKQRTENLKFLNTISKRIGLTDLHYENVIYKYNMFYPIDLESINYGDVTGLYGNELGEIGRLNKATWKLINKFITDIFYIPYRYVPIGTAVLSNYIEGHNSIEDLIGDNTPESRLNPKFKRLYGVYNINYNKLLAYMEKCKKLEIIPYFYSLKYNLYTNDDIKIG